LPPPSSSRPWIAQVIFTPAVESKLATKHGISAEEVKQAVLFSAFRDARWHDHPTFGRRLFVRGTTDEGIPVLAVLKVVNESDGIWECKTARKGLR
jgi:hypothetical protein